MKEAGTPPSSISEGTLMVVPAAWERVGRKEERVCEMCFCVISAMVSQTCYCNSV